jgi:plastocyanin
MNGSRFGLPGLALLLCGSLVLGGCNGGGDDDGNKPVTSRKGGRNSGGEKWDAALGTATIKGKVRFEGDAPSMPVVDMSKEPACQDQDDDARRAMTVRVEGGVLQDVIVWVEGDTIDKYDYPVDGDGPTIKQTGCNYVPRVSGVRSGQEVHLENGDDFDHNVHTYSSEEINSSANWVQAGGVTDSREFEGYDRVTLKCDIHGWMGAYVHVFNHPYYAIVAPDGSFEIPNLPPGEYTVKVWHEKTKKNLRASDFSTEVSVGDGETKTLDDFVFQGR